MFILKKGHQPGVYVPLRALFLVLWRNIENYPSYHFDSDPKFPQLVLYVRWKSGVIFVRRCFCDVKK